VAECVPRVVDDDTRERLAARVRPRFRRSSILFCGEIEVHISDMSCSDDDLVSLLLKLSESQQVAAIVGETLAQKLQPWLRTSQQCADMLLCRLLHLNDALCVTEY
jgi:hypothetical protein